MDAKKRRYSRTSVRVMAWAAGAGAFLLPWAAFRLVATPTPSASAASPQVVVVPAGSKVVLLGAPAGASGVKVVTSKSAGATVSTSKAAPMISTGGSPVPPP